MIERSEIVPQFPVRLIDKKSEFPKIEFKYNSLIEELQNTNEPKTIEILWWIISKSPRIISLIYNLITFFEAIMTNDTKATILGAVKSTLIVVGALFFGDKVSQITGLPDAIVTVVASIWGLVEGIQGFLTNRAVKPKV